ncbi:neurotrimin-like isoform X2 [Parasteatoda tepidariorum]|uniref:neurotrimin-like isoform X2 n=1 Tax=Parasteatoda tepidariorum TaxID=114398 RepID=UPI0039BD1A6D
MYGRAADILLVFLPILSFISSGIEARSNYSRQQKYSQIRSTNCTEDDISITVKCHPNRVRDRVDSSSRNRSMCCSFGHYNSSHPLSCGMTADPTENPTLSTNSCIGCIKYELSTCIGSSLSLVCVVNVSCNDRVKWKRLPDGWTLRDRVFHIKNVQRRDSGIYICEVTDYFGRLQLRGQVSLAVQYPPVILVPNQSDSTVAERLECISEANPPASITWFKDDVPLSAAWYSISSETVDCITESQVHPYRDTNSSSFHSQFHENYTCVASNPHGQSSVTMLYSVFADEISVTSTTERRRFNVTGFIVGMLPPLFISFYIILKLGYRSRYAEERGEDDGFREEPFFISY